MGGLRACLCAVLFAVVAAPAVANDFLFVTTVDPLFTAGSSSSIDLDGAFTTTTGVATIHTDAICRYFNGRVYVVNRSGADNIQVLDPNNGFSTVQQFSVGNGTNPQDIVVLSPTRAYVSRYNVATVLIVNPTNGAQLGTIDLSGLADGDGIPDMTYMARIGDRVFVALQRLTFFCPSGSSSVAVIDTNTDTLVDVDTGTSGVQGIAIAAQNPFSRMRLETASGEMYMACPDFCGGGGSAVQFFDPLTLQSTGTILDEATAGGSVSDVLIVRPDKGYAIVSTPTFNTLLIAFNPQTNTVLGTVMNPGGFFLQTIAASLDGTQLFVADRSAGAGVRVFDTLTDTQVGGPINTGLPPFDMCLSVPVQTSIGDTPSRTTAMRPGYPNPFNPSTTIPFSLSEPTRIRLQVFDAAGALVQTLTDRLHAAGPHQVRWNGRDARGRAVASGVYFARFTTPGHESVQKLVLLK